MVVTPTREGRHDEKLEKAKIINSLKEILELGTSTAYPGFLQMLVFSNRKDFFIIKYNDIERPACRKEDSSSIGRPTLGSYRLTDLVIA